MRLYIIIVILIIASCSKTTQEPKTLDIIQNYLISPENFNALKPESIILKSHTKEQTEYIQFKIEKRPKNYFQVSAPIPGFLESIQVQQGQKIRKGELLVVLSHPEYLDLKTQYLNAKNEYEYQKKHYARQGELAIEMATSLKKMEKSERDFKQAEIDYNGLNEKMKLLGLDVQKLSIEELNSKAYIFSPKNGNVEQINAVSGQYCSNEQSILNLSTGSQKYITAALRNMGPATLKNIVNIFIIPKDNDTINLKRYQINKGKYYYTIEAKLLEDISISNDFLEGIIIQKVSYMAIPKSAIIGYDQIILLNKKNRNVLCRKIRIIAIEKDAIECYSIHVPEGYELVIGKAKELYQNLVEE